MSLRKISTNHCWSYRKLLLSIMILKFIEGNYLRKQVEAIKELADYVTQLKNVGTWHGEWHFDCSQKFWSHWPDWEWSCFSLLLAIQVIHLNYKYITSMYMCNMHVWVICCIELLLSVCYLSPLVNPTINQWLSVIFMSLEWQRNS